MVTFQTVGKHPRRFFFFSNFVKAIFRTKETEVESWGEIQNWRGLLPRVVFASLGIEIASPLLVPNTFILVEEAASRFLWGCWGLK